jgi:hypothetical protein
MTVGPWEDLTPPAPVWAFQAGVTGKEHWHNNKITIRRHASSSLVMPAVDTSAESPQLMDRHLLHHPLAALNAQTLENRPG